MKTFRMSIIGLIPFSPRWFSRKSGAISRLELLPEKLPSALAHGHEIEQAIKVCGHLFMTLDLIGFRSGSLDEDVINIVEVR